MLYRRHPWSPSRLFPLEAAHQRGDKPRWVFHTHAYVLWQRRKLQCVLSHWDADELVLGGYESIVSSGLTNHLFH